MISGQLDDNMLGLFPSFDEWARSGGNELVALESAAVVDCRERIRMSYTTSVFTSLSSGTLCTVYFAEKGSSLREEAAAGDAASKPGMAEGLRALRVHRFLMIYLETA